MITHWWRRNVWNGEHCVIFEGDIDLKILFNSSSWLSGWLIEE